MQSLTVMRARGTILGALISVCAGAPLASCAVGEQAGAPETRRDAGAPVAGANFQPAAASAEELRAARHAKVRLIADRAAVAPGQTMLLGLSFTIDPRWHIYWNGQNDSGSPPSWELALPEGFTAGPARWPAPRRHVAAGDILDHVYEGRVTIVIPITAPASLPSQPGAVTFKAAVDWLVCESVCIPESDAVELTLPIAAGGDGAGASADAALFQEAARSIPGPAPAQLSVEIGEGSATVRMPGGAALAFFPLSGSGDANLHPVEITNLVKSGQARGDTLHLAWRRGPESEQGAGDGVKGERFVLRGVLEVQTLTDATKAYYLLDVKVPADPAGR